MAVLFSQLGPLFKTQLRQAESADTRLEIRRDEKNDQQKKHDFDQGGDETDTLWTDTTAVSVESLRAFLMGFLQSHGNAAPGAAASQVYVSTPVPQARTPATAKAARAMKAYTATAAQIHAPAPPVEEETDQDVNLVDLLKMDEVRTMHQLIHELDILAQRGVQMLTIEKADTFLESLVQAVRLEKAKF